MIKPLFKTSPIIRFSDINHQPPPNHRPLLVILVIDHSPLYGPSSHQKSCGKYMAAATSSESHHRPSTQDGSNQNQDGTYLVEASF